MQQFIIIVNLEVLGKDGGAGNGPSNPKISKWLGDVRTLFEKDLVTVIQSDAIERCGLRQLIFEPELLENLALTEEQARLLAEFKTEHAQQQHKHDGMA